MNMNRDLLVLIGSVAVMFSAVMVILANSIMSSDRNFTAIGLAINEIRELQQNITTTDDDRGQKFVRYLEAESDDTDEELDDLRNITIALSDYHNLTLAQDVEHDSIKFDNGVITFENGTVVSLGDIFAQRH